MTREAGARVAIIGGGFSGVLLARALAPVAAVTVFDKSRGLGGRMATRRVAPFQFDHGSPSFTARSAEFLAFLEPLRQQGLLRAWQGKVVSLLADGRTAKRLWFEPHWVACPGMSTLVKALADGLDLRLASEVLPLEGEGPPWRLRSSTGEELGEYDWVISTAPAPQSARLLAPWSTTPVPWHAIPTEACHALLLGSEQPWPLRWIAAKVHEGPLAWLWVDSSKPGRDASRSCLVAHTSAAWSASVLDAAPETLALLLQQEVSRLTGVDFSGASHVAVHRWRLARATAPEQPAPWIDWRTQLVACGDFSCAPRLESLWWQAQALAAALRPALATLAAS